MFGFQLPELSGYFKSGATWGIVGVTAGIVVIRATLLPYPNPDSLPTVGPSSLLGHWWAGFKFLTNAAEIIQEGYEKHKSAPFKVADRYGWVVFMGNRKHIEELVKAPEDEISFMEAVRDRMNLDHDLERGFFEDPTIRSVVRSHLNKNIEITYPEIRDEITVAFNEVLGLRGDEWKSVQVLGAMQNIVCRTSNRVFVGLPLCQNTDWIDLNIRHTIDVFTTARVIGLFPNFLKPLMVYFFSCVGRNVKHGLKLLGPIIEVRQQYVDQPGNKAEKPNDFLSWLLDEGPQLTATDLVNRVLGVNMVSIHTTSMSFTQALFYLAANPQYIQPLREEVESVVEREGWSKASVSQMHKVDSFLRESLRHGTLSSQAVSCKTLKDYTFSDGTFIPKGMTIGVPIRALHRDNRLYENAAIFEPFRFVDACEDDQESAKHYLVSTAIDYLSFGHGRHACPGRFFAAEELKSMMAHLVVTYDIKLNDNTPRLPHLHFGSAIMPNPRAEVLFRKRVD